MRDGLEKLERAEKIGDNDRAFTLSQDIQVKLSELQKLSTEMDSIYRMQALSSGAAKSTLWKRKIEQIIEEEVHLRQAMERHGTRQHRRQVEDAERRELLQRDVDGRPMHAQMEDDARAQGHVQNSRRLVEEMLDNGATMLVNMSGQRERLKSAHRKLLDTLNSVGLSDSLMRVIERRQTLDKWIVYGGMILVVLLILLLFWLRS